MRTLYGLTLRNLAQRKWRTSVSIAGVALGVSLVFAAGSIAAAANGDRNLSDADHVNTQIISSSGSYLDTALADQARGVPGVQAVSPVLSVSAVVSTDASAALTLQGIDPAADGQLHSRPLAQGSLLSGSEQLLLPAAWAREHNLNIGDRVSLLLFSGELPLPSTLSLTITGTLNISSQSPLSADGYVPLATLQQAMGLQGKASLIEVRYAEGTTAASVLNSLQDTLGENVAFAAPSNLESDMILNMMTNVMLTMSGCVILATAAYLIFNISAMTLAERRADVGRLMALGMTPQQATRNMLVEALIVGTAGGAAGLLLGAALTVPIRLLVDTGMGHPFRTVPLSPLAGLTGFVMGILVTLAATYPIARQAGKVSPLDMIFSQRHPVIQRLTWTTRLGAALLVFGFLGWTFLFAGKTLHTDLQVTTGLGISLAAHMLVLFGALLIIPGFLVRGIYFLQRRVKMRFGLATSLAFSTLQRQPARAARTASTLTIVVAATLMSIGISNAMTSVVTYLLRGFLNPDYLIVSPGNADSSALMAFLSGKPFIPTDPKFYSALDALRDKLFISRLAFGSVQYPELTLLPGMPGIFALDIDEYLPQRGVPLVGATMEETQATFAAGPAIILAQGIADRYKLRVGDTFTLETATGPIQLKVAAIENRFFVSYVDYRQVPAALGGISPFGILLKLRPGVSPAEVEPALSDIASQFGLRFARMAEMTDAFRGLYGSLGTAFGTIGLLTMIVAALGILNTVYTSVIERRRELGVLAAVGGTPVQLRAMILAEAVILGIGGTMPGAVIGSLLGASFGPLNAFAAQIAHEESLGAFTISWLPLTIMLIGAPLVAILAALIPARRITRLKIAEALHYQ